MSGPQRKPDQTAISVSMSKSLLAQLDERAHALGLNRSQYLSQLARADLRSRRELTLSEEPAEYRVSSERKAEIGAEALAVAKGASKKKGTSPPK